MSDDYIIELASLIHSGSNEHDAYNMYIVVEKVKVEVNEPTSAPKATLLSPNNIEGKEPQCLTTCSKKNCISMRQRNL